MRLTRSARIAALAVSAALMVGLAGCSNSDSGEPEGATEEPFTFVALVPNSGALAQVLGVPVRIALETAVKQINEAGGIDGRTVEFDTIDSASDPATAVTNLQSYLATNDKPDAMYAGIVSSEALATLPILTQQEIFNVTTATSPKVNDPATFPYSFTAGASAVDLQTVMADYFAAEGYKNVGYVALDDESGRAAAAAFTAVAEEAGLKVTSDFVPVGSLDASPALDRVRSTNPDALAFNANGPTIGTILTGRTKLQWTVPTYGDATVGAYNLGTMSGPADWENVSIEMMKFAVAGTPEADAPIVQAYSKAYLETSGGVVNSGFYATVTPLQATLFIKAAYEATESNDPADLAAALVEVAGDGGIPDSIADLWIGPSTIGFAEDDHSLDIPAEQVIFAQAGPQENGFLVAE